MSRTNTFTRATLIAAMALSFQSAQAQDVHFTQFNAAPLIVNPAFTGGFSGQWRAAAIYRNQWRSVTAPFVTYGASFDAPVVNDLTHDDFLAVGVQLYNDRAGDGNLTNFSGLASVAYHKFLGEKLDKTLSVGLQGGYTQKSIDLSRLYFGDEFNGGVFQQGTSGEYPGLNNKVNYFTVNAGISWAHSVSDRFGYTLGAAAMNLNQPQESFQKKRNADVGLGIRYAAQLGVIGYVSDKFSLRPAVLYQSQATATELVAGNEFHLIVGDDEYRSIATAVFLGGYIRSNDAMMITAGMEWKGLRFGVSYDYNTSALKAASNGNGGFEISLRYIAPSPLDFARRLVYPCSRF
ncbi:MAG: PorP/SprF family type IX secretion system membrane protein [Bacteroidetes bacterium]|nr:PorP/SprF family type IX secretion system membrane protein [Bacteroidota bacterium]MBS1776316.1 PorP/SprF family type IX secretion system membrane protein [Bacteroidota bacterium]